MTITFDNESDVIVYALEKIIGYARKHQYIFVAQSVWWIASVIGLQDGLAIHIDNLRVRFEISKVPSEVEQPASGKELATLPEHLPVAAEGSTFHPDRIRQIGNTVDVDYEEEDNKPESDRAGLVIKRAKKYIAQSEKARKALGRKACALS